MLRTTLKGLWARKRRMVGTATAVVLGVAFLTGTLVLGDTLDAGFGALFRQANAGTDVIVRSATSIDSDEGAQRPTLDRATVDLVAHVPGVARAVGAVEGTAQLLGTDGTSIGGQGPPTQAGSWIDDPALNPYHVAAGRAPAVTGEVAVDGRSAAEGGIAIGDDVTVLTPDPVHVEVVGLLGFGDETSMAGATYVAFSADQAVEVLGAPGRVSQIRVRGDGTESDTTLRTAIEAALPRHARAEALTGPEFTAEQEADIQGDFLGFLKAFLLAFAGIALVVATFSIANTFSILHAQRSRESALLRAIGAGRGQVLAMALVEAVAIGVGASAIGLGVGLGLAMGLKALMAGFGLDLPGDGLAIEANALGLAMAMGVVATLAAALVPAVRSSRVAPIEALRDAAVEPTSVPKLRIAIGIVLAAIGALTVVTATSADGAVGRAGLGAVLVLVATVALGPVLARPAAATIGAPIAATRGVVGQLARANAVRNPRRTSGAALALVIGAAVVALFATFGSSLSRSIDDTVRRSFGGDLVVMQDGFSGAGLSPQLAREIDALAEVGETVALSNATARIDGATVYPTAGDPAAMAKLLDLDVREGDLADVDHGTIAVSESYAQDHHLELGDELAMGFADGQTARFEVRAVYGVGDLLGDIVMDDADWNLHTVRPSDAAILVGLSDGTSLEDGRAAVEAVAKDHGRPNVEDREQYIDRVAGQVDQLLTVVYALLLLAIVIALIGLANTLSLSIHERSRELGLLRAVGLTRAKLRSMVRWESVITAVVGTVVGLALGTFLGWGLVRALSAQEGFVSFQLPTSSLLVVLAASLVAGVLAAVRPAHRAAKLDVLDAISEP